jgi:arylsulfatase A-like enzyme
LFAQLYQAGAVVPFFISGPNFIEGGRIDENLVSNVDLARTLFEVASGDDSYPFFTDGISFLPIVRGEEVRRISYLRRYFLQQCRTVRSVG